MSLSLYVLAATACGLIIAAYKELKKDREVFSKFE